jgi:hypothetical protein
LWAAVLYRWAFKQNGRINKALEFFLSYRNCMRLLRVSIRQRCKVTATGRE